MISKSGDIIPPQCQLASPGNNENLSKPRRLKRRRPESSPESGDDCDRLLRRPSRRFSLIHSLFGSAKANTDPTYDRLLNEADPTVGADLEQHHHISPAPLTGPIPQPHRRRHSSLSKIKNVFTSKRKDLGGPEENPGSLPEKPPTMVSFPEAELEYLAAALKPFSSEQAESPRPRRTPRFWRSRHRTPYLPPTEGRVSPLTPVLETNAEAGIFHTPHRWGTLSGFSPPPTPRSTRNHHDPFRVHMPNFRREYLSFRRPLRAPSLSNPTTTSSANLLNNPVPDAPARERVPVSISEIGVLPPSSESAESPLSSMQPEYIDDVALARKSSHEGHLAGPSTPSSRPDPHALETAASSLLRDIEVLDTLQSGTLSGLDSTPSSGAGNSQGDQGQRARRMSVDAFYQLREDEATEEGYGIDPDVLRQVFMEGEDSPACDSDGGCCEARGRTRTRRAWAASVK